MRRRSLPLAGSLTCLLTAGALTGCTVFLRRLTDGWQVRAAGCQSQPGAAYRCDVDG